MEKITIKPSRGWVILEPLEEEEMSSGGVALPERVQEKPAKSKVLAVGAKIPLMTGEWVEFEWEVGDIVVHKRFIDNKVTEAGKDYLIARFEDCLAKYG